MRKRKWTEKQLIDGAKAATSIRQLIYNLGLIPAGGNYAQIKRYLVELKIDTAHFKGKAWNKGLIGIGKPRFDLKEILVKDRFFQSYKLKRRLFLSGLKKPVCEECSWARTATDGRTPLELHHVNGDARDNRLKNLKILCPNCHSLKLNHRGKNIKRKL